MSGSLPPGFPWTVIDGKAYWNGGIVSNSPIDLVIDRCGPDGKRVFIVDLFSGRSPLPTNMMEVLLRRDEIVYSERIRSDLRHRETIGAYRKLIDHLLTHLAPAEIARIKHLPAYIQLMGDGAATTITRFVPPGRDRERADRNAGDDVRENLLLFEGLDDTALEGAESTAALKDQCRPRRNMVQGKGRITEFLIARTFTRWRIRPSASRVSLTGLPIENSARGTSPLR